MTKPFAHESAGQGLRRFPIVGEDDDMTVTSEASTNAALVLSDNELGSPFDAATEHESAFTAGGPEVTAVLPSGHTLAAVLRDLFASGFEKTEVSALATCAGVRNARVHSKTVEGAPFAAAPGAEIGPASEGLVCFINVGDCAAVVAGGGALAFAVAAALLTNAGSLGCWDFVAHTVAPRHRAAIAALVADGGALLWVKAAGPTRRNQAARILERHRARYLHLHRVGN